MSQMTRSTQNNLLLKGGTAVQGEKLNKHEIYKVGIPAVQGEKLRSITCLGLH